MLDRIQRLSIFDEKPYIYDRIWKSARKVGTFDSPNTHLVANIEDLTEGPIERLLRIRLCRRGLRRILEQPARPQRTHGQVEGNLHL